MTYGRIPHVPNLVLELLHCILHIISIQTSFYNITWTSNSRAMFSNKLSSATVSFRFDHILVADIRGMTLLSSSKKTSRETQRQCVLKAEKHIQITLSALFSISSKKVHFCLTQLLPMHDSGEEGTYLSFLIMGGSMK